MTNFIPGFGDRVRFTAKYVRMRSAGWDGISNEYTEFTATRHFRAAVV